MKISTFDPDLLREQVSPGGLRYLTHAIRPGTPVANEVVISFSGRVRLDPSGPWMPFRAIETIHAGRSYQVTAHARRGPLRAKIEDTYDAGRARSRVRVLGIIPVRSQDGADLVRSARGRLVAESTWLPSAFLPAYGTRWSAGNDGENITVPVDGEHIEAALQLGAEGELVELVELRLSRWSNLTENGRWGWVPFSAKVQAHRSFDGYTIPSDVRASWATGTEREFEFFHATVEHAQFRA